MNFTSVLRVLALLLLAPLVLAGCPERNSGRQDDALSGRVMLWHSLPAEQEKALSDVVGRFQAIHPATDIIVRSNPSERALVDEYLRAANSGLGADVLLLSSDWLAELNDAGWLQPIDERMDDGQAQDYLATALATVTQGDHLYGLPASLDTQALYYNNTLVDRPATTLEQLLDEARNGLGVAMHADFVDTFWAFRALSADFAGPDPGSIQVTPGGFANWISWLQSVRATPNVVMDGDVESLRARFLDGTVAYYVGRAAELPVISAAMGNRVSVTPLPSGPGGSAGPFLRTRALFFNKNSSPDQTRLAYELARFITNPEQQASLMRDAQWVPTNVNTRISPGVYPNIASFETQARTSLPWIGDPDLIAVLAILDDTFSRVLNGLARPVDVVALLAEHDAVFANFDVPPTPPCSATGELRVAAVDTGQARPMLQALVDGFALECPDVQVDLMLLPAEESALLYGDGATPRLAADVVYGRAAAPRDLAARGVAADISGAVDRDLLQSLLPGALEAMRTEGRLFGLPVDLQVPALFFNRAQVDNPPSTLDDLRTQANAGVPVALDRNFVPAAWGIGAFGGTFYDPQGNFTLAPDALTGWLTWLQASQAEHGIALFADDAPLRAAFGDGATAYYVGMPDETGALKERLGTDLGLSVLPEGPAGQSSPLLSVGSLVLDATAAPAVQEAGVRFMSYAAGASSQSQLADALGIVPANAGARMPDDPFVAIFLSQAANAQAAAGQPGWNDFVQLGDAAMRQVFEEGIAPDEAVGTLFARLAEFGIDR